MYKKILLFIFFTTIVMGCSVKEEEKLFNPKESYKLKVLYYDSESFYTKYGNYINMEFPNLEFEIVPLKLVYTGEGSLNENLLKLVSSEQPDILFLNREYMKTLQAEHQLLPLRALLGEDEINSLHKGAVELLEWYGDGEIYGVATSFVASALFYNKTLFAKNGVNIPDEPMSWNQFSHLVQRFDNSDEAAFYFQNADPSALFTIIGFFDGLSYLDKANNKITLNTDSWAEVAEVIKPLYEKKLIQSSELSSGDNLFSSGLAAITVADHHLFFQLSEMQLPFEWGVLPLPGRDHSQTNISLENIVAIHNQSIKAKESVKLIQFLASEKMSKIIDNTSSTLSTSIRSSIAKDKDHPLHFIYERSANIFAEENYNRIQSMSEDFLESFMPYFSEHIQKIVRGEIQVRDGLQKIEDYGNKLLES